MRPSALHKCREQPTSCHYFETLVDGRRIVGAEERSEACQDPRAREKGIPPADGQEGETTLAQTEHYRFKLSLRWVSSWTVRATGADAPHA